MDRNMDYKNNKAFRILEIENRLSKGEVLFKADLAMSFGVTEKTIQRDIDELRNYLEEKSYSEIHYDHKQKGYVMESMEREWLTNKEVMAICKILLESRAFRKDELEQLVQKLIHQVTPNDRKRIQEMIVNEKHHYIPLHHNQPLLDMLWNLTHLILHKKVITFNYTRQDGVKKVRKVKPVSIMFSEFYFYLIAYLYEQEEDCPIVFRMDRIKDIKETNETFQIPYSKRFSEGEFRKRVQFMYTGKLKTVRFEFTGPSLEAMLDRLPTAKILKQENGVTTLEAESYGSGIDMWLSSQGDWVRVLE